MKRSTRRRLTHLALYAALLVIAVVVVLLVDWDSARANFFDFGTMAELLPDMIVIGVRNTLIYTVIAFVGGLALALLLALMKLSPARGIRWLATSYVEFFRGLPSLIVIIAMALGVPIAFGWTLPGGTMGAGLLALILVSAAYMAETLRAGIQAVPRGQNEAARTLGMNAASTMRHVILPQAFRIVIPPLTNEFVLLIKDTALLFVVGLAADQRELTTLARDFMSSGPTAGTANSLMLAAILYLVITLPLTRLVAWLEAKQAKAR